MQHPTSRRYPKLALSAMLAMCSLAMSSSHAALSDLTTTPLGSSTNGTVVKPNVLFILDGSGSMNWTFSPDNVDRYTCCGGTVLLQQTSYTCRTDSAGINQCTRGDPPYQADMFNGLAYNPQTTYKPGMNYDSTSRGNMNSAATAAWTAVPVDSYWAEEGIANTKVNIVTSFNHQAWCTVAGCSATAARFNGVHNTVLGVNSYAYATPPKPALATVSFTRVGTAVTGTKVGHNVAVNDFIDVVAGSCSATQALVTAVPTASTFTYTWGDATKMAACTAVSGTVNFSVMGYPEAAGVTLQPTTNVTKAGTTVTVTYPGHRFIAGDQVDITGGTDSSFTVATSGICPPGTGTVCKDTVLPKTKVTVNKAAHGFVVGDIIDVTVGGASCLGTGVAVTTVPDASHFTFTSTAAAAGTCSGTYTFTKKGTVCNTVAAGATVLSAVGTSFTVTIAGTGSCNGSYTAARRKANIARNTPWSPVINTLSPVEYCSDLHLTDCVASTSPVSVTVPGRPNGGVVNFTFPAYLRYCASAAGAAAAPIAATPATIPSVAPSGAGILCVDKFYEPTYIYPRYGLFTRGDIVPTIPAGYPGAGSTATFGNRPNRADCAGAPTCTYAEEMTNFANWYAYYRRRMQAMKTAGGLSFAGLDDRYRVGFMVILPSSPIVKCTVYPCATTAEFLPIDVFNPTQKQKFYSIFYGQDTGGGTPLRAALARAGRYFAHKTTGINNGITDDPVQYSCQQNFALLTTDGMWKGSGDGVQLDGTTQVGNQDGSLADPGVLSDGSKVVSRAAGTYDGGCPAGDVENAGGCANTLADVALYYYRTDLRTTALGNQIGATGQDVTANNVPTTDADQANWQHMVTFGLALADGLMTWQSDYATASTGDYKNITTGASGCWWSGAGACNWPTPVAATPPALDDLWHAAVNGHGTYFHAGDAQSLTNGLTGALAGMSARTAAAAASATSSPQITPLDNVIYSTTYETVDWSGQLVAQYVDTSTGAPLPTILWESQAALDGTVGATSDSRTIYTFDTAASNHLKSFTYSGFSATEQGWVDNACVPASKLSQCSSLSAPQLTWVNAGANIVNFVRGQTQNEITHLRDRKHALGDTVDAAPVYVRGPTFAFADAVTPSYATFKSTNASRQSVIYLAANDGMLHAFDARVGGSSAGAELWAYVPRMLLSNLYKLADSAYASKHQFYVDGTPTVMDAYFGGSWRTILVGGLNNGGRGYYALDVTNPTSPQALWEFCSDTTVCGATNFDVDMGYTYGNPVITKLPDGRWVAIVTSGYNNVTPGDGLGHLYVLDLATGTKLYKLNTTAGSVGSPSGLGRISAYADNFQQDNTAKYVYGGDLAGNVWRFSFIGVPGTAPSIQLLGTLADSGSRPQSVTTRPELGYLNGSRIVFVGTGRYLGSSDLTDPATWTPASTDAYQQSLYAFKDTGANLGNLRTSGNLVQQTLTNQSTTARTTSNNTVDWTSKNGWFVDFNPAGDSPGERININMELDLGTLTVKTNVPNVNACVFGGDSWTYQFRYDTGTYVSTSPGQVVGQKITGALTVGFVIVGLPGGGMKDITTTATGEKKVYGVNIGGNAGSGKRIGWREVTQ